MIITTEERTKMINHLRDTLNQSITSINQYSKKEDVSRKSLDTLVLSPDFGGIVYKVNDHFVRESYEQTLANDISEKIASSIQNLE